MKVILKQDVRQVGFKDDVLNVKNGYANNFLLPKGLAVVANESNMKMLAENTKQATYKQEKVKKDALGMSESLNDLNVTLGAKAGANGKIFGSITPLQLAQALKLKGYEVDRRKIVFDQDIKNVGSYTATLNLHKEVSVKVNVEVVAE
jgi:large subunit ribosomal protein L9